MSPLFYSSTETQLWCGKKSEEEIGAFTKAAAMHSLYRSKRELDRLLVLVPFVYGIFWVPGFGDFPNLDIRFLL